MNTKNHAHTKEAYQRWLDDLDVPENDRAQNGGLIPDRVRFYGRWMRKNDPIAFNVGYGEWAREASFRESNPVTR